MVACVQAVQIGVDAGICDDVWGDFAKTTDERMIASIARGIRAQPQDCTALDAVKRAAKVEAWRKAEAATLGLATGHECRAAILSLIEREGV